MKLSLYLLLLALVVTTLSVVTCTLPKQQPTYRISKIDTESRISESKCLISIKEHITYLFNGRFTVMTRTIPSSISYKKLAISNLVVKSDDVSITSSETHFDEHSNLNILWRFNGLKDDDQKKYVSFYLSYNIEGIFEHSENEDSNVFTLSYPLNQQIDELHSTIYVPENSKILSISPKDDGSITDNKVTFSKSNISKRVAYTLNIKLKTSGKDWPHCEPNIRKIENMDSKLTVSTDSCYLKVNELLSYRFRGTHTQLIRQIPKRITYGTHPKFQQLKVHSSQVEITKAPYVRNHDNATYIIWEFNGVESGVKTVDFNLEYQAEGMMEYKSDKFTNLTWSFQVHDPIDSAKATIYVPFIHDSKEIKVYPKSEATVYAGKVMFHKQSIQKGNFDVSIEMPSRYGGKDWKSCRIVTNKRRVAAIVGITLGVLLVSVCAIVALVYLVSSMVRRRKVAEYETLRYAPTAQA
jgi:hypothetical protein